MDFPGNPASRAAGTHVKLPDLRVWNGASIPEPIRITSRDDFNEATNIAIRMGISDMVMVTGLPLMANRHGELTALTRPIQKAEMENVINWITGQAGVVARLQGGRDYDQAFEVKDTELLDRFSEPVRHRFRLNLTANYFNGDTGYQAVMRYINPVPPTPAEVTLEPQILTEAAPHSGQILIGGRTGSGKTRTIAAILRHIIEGKTHIAGNIVTYESPIEYLFDEIPSPACVVSQSEIPQHLPTFFDASVNALRRAPAYAMIQELRDAPTIQSAVELANTGHPLISTTHAHDAALIFRRMAQRFPFEQQSQAFYSLVQTTHMLVHQMLVRSAHGGYTALREWQVITPSVRDRLEDAGPSHYHNALRQHMDDPSNDDGSSMRRSVIRVLAEGRITRETAIDVLRNYRYSREEIADAIK